jgi:hypothetical protein
VAFTILSVKSLPCSLMSNDNKKGIKKKEIMDYDNPSCIANCKNCDLTFPLLSQLYVLVFEALVLHDQLLCFF